jgi:acyl carrier protein
MGPEAEITRTVTAAWSDLLGVPGSPEDDFFALGGDSMLALTLMERIESELGIEFPLEVLFVEGTLGALVAACVGAAADPASA